MSTRQAHPRPRRSQALEPTPTMKMMSAIARLLLLLLQMMERLARRTRTTNRRNGASRRRVRGRTSDRRQATHCSSTAASSNLTATTNSGTLDRPVRKGRGRAIGTHILAAERRTTRMLLWLLRNMLLLLVEVLLVLRKLMLMLLMSMRMQSMSMSMGELLLLLAQVLGMCKSSDRRERATRAVVPAGQVHRRQGVRSRMNRQWRGNVQPVTRFGPTQPRARGSVSMSVLTLLLLLLLLLRRLATMMTEHRRVLLRRVVVQHPVGSTASRCLTERARCRGETFADGRGMLLLLLSLKLLRLRHLHLRTTELLLLLRLERLLSRRLLRYKTRLLLVRLLALLLLHRLLLLRWALLLLSRRHGTSRRSRKRSGRWHARVHRVDHGRSRARRQTLRRSGQTRARRSRRHNAAADPVLLLLLLLESARTRPTADHTTRRTQPRTRDARRRIGDTRPAVAVDDVVHQTRSWDRVVPRASGRLLAECDADLGGGRR